LAGSTLFGCSYPGVPAFLIGRNAQLAWGITNNICLQRDLCIEELDASGEHYRDGDAWRAFERRIERIEVKNNDPYELELRSAHGRPVIDHLVPEAVHPQTIWPETRARSAVSLAWVGFEASDEIASALALGRATTIAEGREAFRGWKLPTWNIVLADVTGKIAYQCIGELPLRGREWIGYRDANDAIDRWQEPIPYDAMPALIEPERGWVGSANNPTAPPDFPYPLFGCWTPEDRFPRLSQLIEERAPHSLDSFATMQADIFSGRGKRAIDGIVASVGEPADSAEAKALSLLAGWDGVLSTDSTAGSIYNVFFWQWHQQVVRERFPDRWTAIANESGNGLSAALLHGNLGEWFPDEGRRRDAIKRSFSEAIAWLRDRLGPDPDTWLWGNLHTLGAVHPAARTPLQHLLFDVEAKPHHGGTSTLANAHFGLGGSFATRLGASYRFMTDLANAESTRAICWPGQSGHPGSSHYVDQHAPYLRNDYFPALDEASEVIELRAKSRN
jgi:penicillin amidase